jgi:hypothetical protein
MSDWSGMVDEWLNECKILARPVRKERVLGAIVLR